MHSFQESLVSWATILGTFLSVFGLVQSRPWLIGMSALFFGTSIIAGLYARQEHLIVNSGGVKIEGRSIDSLNIANLTRRRNRTLVIQEAHQVARIEGEDLRIAWQYVGYCRADQETAIEFSIDTDNNIPFDQLECFAYDLRSDPGQEHKIRPLLVGTDGISKKIAVPFLQPVAAHQPFSVLLECWLPGCMKAGLEYYTSTLSFDQDVVGRATVQLIFIGDRPDWVRVYECAAARRPKLLKDLRPLREDQEISEYLDTSVHMEAQSRRVYMFWRDAAATSTH